MAGRRTQLMCSPRSRMTRQATQKESRGETALSSWRLRRGNGGKCRAKVSGVGSRTSGPRLNSRSHQRGVTAAPRGPEPQAFQREGLTRERSDERACAASGPKVVFAPRYLGDALTGGQTREKTEIPCAAGLCAGGCKHRGLLLPRLRVGRSDQGRGRGESTTPALFFSCPDGALSLRGSLPYSSHAWQC